MDENLFWISFTVVVFVGFLWLKRSQRKRDERHMAERASEMKSLAEIRPPSPYQPTATGHRNNPRPAPKPATKPAKRTQARKVVDDRRQDDSASDGGLPMLHPLNPLNPLHLSPSAPADDTPTKHHPQVDGGHHTHHFSPDTSDFGGGDSGGDGGGGGGGD